MNTILIKTKAELLAHREAIENLFLQSFGQRSIGAIWDWAYIDNPNGEPFVALSYDGNALVGHYAIVPMPLVRGTERLNSYISMTTMVAESHRKFGLFTSLAQETYKMAQEAGVDCVAGFPNSQSTPGFKKRLNWDLPEPDFVAAINKSTLVALADKGYFEKKEMFSLNLSDEKIREWRLARPGGNYKWSDGIASKEHQRAIDLIWWKDTDSLLAMPDYQTINVLVTAASGLESKKVFDYQFGGISLSRRFDPMTISREMAISDLF
jgi:hypothetical protein